MVEGIAGIDWSLASTWMPMVFFVLMGVSVFAYAVLDGYDLGIGMLMPLAGDSERDMMVASIGPFWDANETWLVMGVGLLLVAFPEAHGVVLGELYMPVAAMLFGLTLRGVAFDFRAKSGLGAKKWWDRSFMCGSAMAAYSQGVMCGRYVTGFADGFGPWAFALAVGLGVCAFYAWLGSGWLVLKTQGDLQRKAVAWGAKSLACSALTVLAVSAATPLASAEIWGKWFEHGRWAMLSPIPLATAMLFVVGGREFKRLGRELEKGVEGRPWTPLACGVGVACLSFLGLGYSVFPYVAVGRLTMWQAAADVSALGPELLGAAIALPAIFCYTAWVYGVFKGKAKPLDYH